MSYSVSTEFISTGDYKKEWNKIKTVANSKS